jgi:hypothetical protein
VAILAAEARSQYTDPLRALNEARFVTWSGGEMDAHVLVLLPESAGLTGFESHPTLEGRPAEDGFGTALINDDVESLIFVARAALTFSAPSWFPASG